MNEESGRIRVLIYSGPLLSIVQTKTKNYFYPSATLPKLENKIKSIKTFQMWLINLENKIKKYDHLPVVVDIQDKNN